MKPVQKEKWLDSKAARKALKVSACELSHIREAGKLQSQKRGNAFLYAESDVNGLAEHGSKRDASLNPAA